MGIDIAHIFKKRDQNNADSELIALNALKYPKPQKAIDRLNKLQVDLSMFRGFEKPTNIEHKILLIKFSNPDIA